MKIGVIGCGYVGLVTAAGLASIGHDVVATDKDDRKLIKLAGGELPIYEPGLESLVKSVTGVVMGEVQDLRQGHHLLRYASIEETIKHGDVLFICVGTPPLRNGGADLSAIDEVAGYVSEFADHSKLLVEKSTVPAGTGKALARALASRLRRATTPHKVASNPEFLREGSAVTDFLHPERIVVGVEDDESRHLLGEVYQPILAKSVNDTQFIVTTIESAELIKHASNSFLAMKVSYANLVSDVAEKVGANVEQVLHAVGLDRRIGEQFLRPGLGFGGFCLPKDLRAFRRLATLKGVDAKLLEATEEINENRVFCLVEKVREALWTLNGKTIATLGVAFKPGTDDVRYSQATAAIRALLEEGAIVRATDPIVKSTGALGTDMSKLRYYPNAPYEAVRGADALVILTEWPEYRNLDWTQVRGLMTRPLIIDGRNMLSNYKMHEYGFSYLSFGRSNAQ